MGVVERARLELRLRGGQGALRAMGGFGRELDRALEEGRGGRKTTTRLRPGCGMLQFRGNVLIGGRRRLRSVPGAAVGVDFGIGRLRKRAVDLAPLVRAGCPVDSRPNQWV